MNYDSRKNFITAGILTTMIIALMVAAVEISGEKEILFPEIAAIATGNLLNFKRSWNVSPMQMILFITAGAFSGLGIVAFFPGSFILQFITAFVLSQIMLMISGTTFAPMISAVVLPVVLQTKSIIYPISAFVFTTLIVIVRITFEKKDIRPREKSEINRDEICLTRRSVEILIRALIVFIVASAAIHLNIVFVCAPPLLVFFTELSNNSSGKTFKETVKIIVFMTICAFDGAVLRYILSMKFLLLPAFTAAVAVMVYIVVTYIFKMYLPPAGAITLLAFLIPEGSVISYPFQILAGVVFFAVVINIKEKCKNKVENIKSKREFDIENL